MNAAERSHFPLTEDHILTLSAESDTLDFKASAKLTENLVADVSNWVGAFANGTGGSIIFGIRNPVAGLPLECDGGFPTNHKGGTREWLEDMPNGIVQPRLKRFNVWEVTPSSESSTIKAGHALYVIDVPASGGRARQSKDGKYHVKAGSKTRALNDEEIQRLNARELELAAVADVRIQPHKSIDSTLIVCLRNTGENLIRDLRFELLLPPEIPGIGCFSCEDSEMLYHEEKVWINFFVPALSHPLFRDQPDVHKWHLEFQSGLTFETAAGKEREFSSNVGYSTLWLGSQPPIRTTLDLSTAIQPPLFYQPERKKRLVTS